MKRRFDPAVLEMMDRDQPPSAELERDLERIRQLNRWFGSYHLVLGFIRSWIRPADKLRVVDLATGSGDIPRLIVDYARKISAVKTFTPTVASQPRHRSETRANL